MTTDDPFVLLTKPMDDWPSDVDLFWTAVKRFDPADPSPLVKLLESNDVSVSRSGLNVFGELGRKGAVVLDAALKLYAHPHDMARNALMDGVICYPESLNAEQAGTILKLVTDPFTLVREKVICFLAHANPRSLEPAVASLDDPLRREHRKGLDVLYVDHPSPQVLFDEAVARDDIWSAYAMASIERMTRNGLLERAPEYTGNNYVVEGVVAHVQMHIARHDLKRRKKISPGARYRKYKDIIGNN